jgi:choline dehydrogenase
VPTPSHPEFDYVIVGAGSAGCVLAARLSEDRSARVLLLEAGGHDRSPFIRVPAGVKQLSPKLNWRYEAEPDSSRDGIVEAWAAGKVLGGSSSINGMAWVRGHRADYDAWAADFGCTGWDFDSMLPYFLRMETWEGLASEWRGRNGPLHTSPMRISHVMSDTFVRAGGEAGLPVLEDYNGVSQAGVAHAQVSQRRGWRHSAARAYLAPARRRRNLVVRTGAEVRRVVIEGDRAVGVEVRSSHGIEQVRATREVILSAGTLSTPKLLMLSGIGPAAHLREHGLAVVADRREVGANLQEHPITLFLHRVDVRTLNRELTASGVIRHGLDFALRGRGAVASSACHAMAYAGRADTGASKYQVMFSPFGVIGKPSANKIDHEGEAAVLADAGGSGPRLTHDVNAMRLLPEFSVTTYPCLLHPRARGSVRLRSGDPADRPAITHRVLGDPQDVAGLIEAARLVRAIYDTPAMKERVLEEMRPGPGVQTDDEWARYLRTHTFRAEHPVGTARMGADEDSVVDPQLRVRGVRGLRVADASVLPTLVSGNTNAATMVVAERAADLIRGTAASGQLNPSQLTEGS